MSLENDQTIKFTVGILIAIYMKRYVYMKRYAQGATATYEKLKISPPPPYILFRRTGFVCTKIRMNVCNIFMLQHIRCHSKSWWFAHYLSLRLALNWDASLPSSPDDILFEWSLIVSSKWFTESWTYFLSAILPARRVLREEVIGNSLYTL